jgi:hypothetical protein
MKIIWYLGVFVSGALGLLLLLRSLEKLLAGGGLAFAPVAMGMLALLGARTCLRRARARASRTPPSTPAAP